MTIERYEPAPVLGDMKWKMFPEDDGRYVLASDYDALLALAKELRDQLSCARLCIAYCQSLKKAKVLDDL